MPDENQRKYLFDKPRNVNLFFRVFYAACVILLVLDFILHRHASRAWEGLPGFYAFYGFAGFVTLVLVAKAMRRVLMRGEDYYDVDE